jgi:hypothetical protein
MAMPVALSLIALFLAACAAVPRPPGGVETCTARFAEIDARVERAGVRDADAARIEGFPHLRIDRLLASLALDAERDAATRAAWLGRLAALDASGRAAELRALERDPRQRDRLRVELDRCRDALVAGVAADAAAFARLRAAARVPDAYRRWQRVLGAYPLAALAAARGVSRMQREENPEPRDLRDVPAGTLIHAPPAGAGGIDRRALAASLAAAPRDALDLPQPAPALLAQLFAAHSPVWVVEHRGEADTIGRVIHDGNSVRIDTAEPTVYQYPSFTRFDGRVLLQLNYVVWFPARPKSGPFDLLGGPIDGLTWRVTLDLDGEPLVHDSMHNCGCYHLWLPGPRLVARGPAGTRHCASATTTRCAACHSATGGREACSAPTAWCTSRGGWNVSRSGPSASPRPARCAAAAITRRPSSARVISTTRSGSSGISNGWRASPGRGGTRLSRRECGSRRRSVRLPAA